MKKTTIKNIITLLISIILLFVFCNSVLATFATSYYQPSSMDDATGATTIKNIGNTIIGIIQIIGTITSVLVLAILGIKYMLGSAEERAEYKKSMTPYLIGAVMVFAITNLLGIIAPIAKNLWGTKY